MIDSWLRAWRYTVVALNDNGTEPKMQLKGALNLNFLNLIINIERFWL